MTNNNYQLEENMVERNLEMMNFNRTHKVTVMLNGYGFAIKIGRRTWSNNVPFIYDIANELVDLRDAGLNIDNAIIQFNNLLGSNMDTFEEYINECCF